MNAALLALLPLGLLGAGAGLFARGWLDAFAAASPSIAPPWWRALPPLLLAVGAGACWGGRRLRELRLAQAATWLAVAAAGALLAPWLLQALAPPLPDARAGSGGAAAWLGALLPAAACGGALVLLMATREARAGRVADSRGASCACAVLGLLLGWHAAGPGADGLPWLPVAPETAAAGAFVAAALLARLLAGSELGDASPREAPGGPLALAAALGLVAASGFSVATLAQVGATSLRLLGAPAPASADELALGLVLGLLLALAVGRVPADTGEVATPRRPFDTLGLAGCLMLLPVTLAGQLLAAGDLEGLPSPLFLLASLTVPLALALGIDGPRRPTPARAGLGLLALSAGCAVAVAWPALEAADIEPLGTRALFVRGTVAALAVALLALAFRPRAQGKVAAASRAVVDLATLGLLLTTLVAGAPELPWRREPPEARLLATVEGLRGVSTLVGLPDGRAEPRRDGWPLVGGESGALQLRRAGRLAAALKPDARQAALLLRDDGALLASLAALTPADVTCIEPDAALVVLQPDIAWEPGQDARGAAPRLVVDEPRAWLLAHPRSQDLVVQNAFAPDGPGAQGWLTQEHFLALRGALREGGVAVVVLPLQRLPWPACAAAGAAFLQAFPDARLLVASLRGDAPLALLAGGLTHGLPGSAALDALLGAVPSAAGPNGAPDVFDLYVCDGWTLAARWRDETPATLAAPRAAWLSAGRATDAPLLARLNLRLLADLAVPLETTSLQARPIDEKEARRLGAELTARSAALTGLLAARAAQLALDQAAPGELSDDQRAALEAELASALLHAWRSAPGHLDARDALLERAARLARDGRDEAAATLLDLAVQALPEPRLAGLLGGLLLRLERGDQALALLEPAHKAAPEDRVVSLHLACALLSAARDAEAHAVLEGAARVAAPGSLPAVPAAALGLLRGDVAAVAPAREVLRGLPGDDPWAGVLARLLGTPPAGGPPPGR